ncbi:MAG: V-type ATPase, V0 complex, 116kDa subunit family [Monoraphidium minutum]|nr:MAG: V-type ATPase, V0 complex, 116kDa subunit family [Monoraphidium minutum]
MQLVQLMIPAESAHGTVGALGDAGLLQFRDLNSGRGAFQRAFAGQVKRCDEMARQIRYLQGELEKAGVVTGGPASAAAAAAAAVAAAVAGKRPAGGCQLEDLESRLQELEAECQELAAARGALARRHAELAEMALVQKRAGDFFAAVRAGAEAEHMEERARAAAAADGTAAPLMEAGAPPAERGVALRQLSFVAGVVAQSKAEAFERLLFRVTRGNVLLRLSEAAELLDPASGEAASKAAFLVFFSGDRARAKVEQVCAALGANRYPFADDAARQAQALEEATARMRELHTTMETGDRHRQAALQQVVGALGEWATQVRRDKAIYHVLNKLSMDASRKVLVGHAWVPAASKGEVLPVLQRTAEASSTQLPAVLQPLTTSDPPPTYFRTSKFTSAFQGMIESYGVARYREVNPAVYTIATFPFLFGVMFGDLGHGLLLLMFALFLVLGEKKLAVARLDEISTMLFGGRYIVLLMAVFSVFTGVIYNEFFSIPMTIFGRSAAKCVVAGEALQEVTDLRTCPVLGGTVAFPRGAPPYPFGVDPVWHGTKAELPFLNSMKMKMSILMGVVHMNMGIVHSLANNRYFKDTLSTICEFVPQVIFLNALFGYLCAIIVMKWVTGATTDL